MVRSQGVGDRLHCLVICLWDATVADGAGSSGQTWWSLRVERESVLVAAGWVHAQPLVVPHIQSPPEPAHKLLGERKLPAEEVLTEVELIEVRNCL